MPQQIIRLLLLTVVIGVSYLIARFFLTPPSFGEYGWFRGDAIREIASLPRSYAGKKACGECHSDQIKQIESFEHKTLSCEACHGAALAHSEDPDVKVPKFAFNCVRCHESDPSKPKWLKQINSRKHYAGQKCTECHLPHHPGEVP